MQTKLTVNQPGDLWEREADRVADEVMRAAGPRAGGELSAVTPVASPRPQRTCASCAAGGEPCTECADEEEKTVQRKEAAGVAEPTAEPAERRSLVPPGQAQPLSSSVRADFESRFGRDFRPVRVHTDERAVESARSLSALAYTVGDHIVFGRGQFQPGTETGRRLLAHELTHTLQQTANPTARGFAMRRWDPAGAYCAAEPADKWVERIVVEQETPQSITLHWNDGTLDGDECSTGKGHCCVSATAEGTPCPTNVSRQDGSNCTAISEGAGFPVLNRYRSRNGWQFWTDIVPARGIGMHQYPVPYGTPLSHGCVRLREPMARKIYCGVRQNQTRVQVTGFARPQCSSQALLQEWQDDLDYARTPTDGENVSAAVRRGVAATRRTLREAFGVNEAGLNELLAEPNDEVLARIPRCASTAPLPTSDEGLLFEGQGSQPTTPAQILAASGFDEVLTPFLVALSQATSLATTRTAVRNHGRALWRMATRRAQRATDADTDDRPLYWERLEMTRALRQWQPRFPLTAPQREGLIDLLERTSRGMDTARFPPATGVKRILISGFDPFALNESDVRLPPGSANIRGGNPSGPAVLALDGRTIRNGSVTARVEGVIFPVRFADFDAGKVESFFSPYLNGTTPVDMIMTISQGGDSQGSNYDLEEFTARNRSSESPDNLGQLGGGSQTSPAAPPGLAAGPEFLTTELPTTAIRDALGRPVLAGEREGLEILPGATRATALPSGGPTPGSTSVTGSGGGYLSNEISYRTLLLRRGLGATVPVGHLHTPVLAPPQTGISSEQFATAHRAIVDAVTRILEAALPTLGAEREE